jgi:hypothetical protein
MNVLYRLLRFLTRKTLQIYFKNISFSGKNRLETDDYYGEPSGFFPGRLPIGLLSAGAAVFSGTG